MVSLFHLVPIVDGRHLLVCWLPVAENGPLLQAIFYMFYYTGDPKYRRWAGPQLPILTLESNATPKMEMEYSILVLVMYIYRHLYSRLYYYALLEKLYLALFVDDRQNRHIEHPHVFPGFSWWFLGAFPWRWRRNHGGHREELPHSLWLQRLWLPHGSRCRFFWGIEYDRMLYSWQMNCISWIKVGILYCRYTVVWKSLYRLFCPSSPCLWQTSFDPLAQHSMDFPRNRRWLRTSWLSWRDTVYLCIQSVYSL